MTLAFGYNLIAIAFRSAFYETRSRHYGIWLALDLSADLMFIGDLFVQIHLRRRKAIITGKDNRKVEGIRKFYKDDHFAMDVLSTIPFDYGPRLFKFVQLERYNLTPEILRLNRLIRYHVLKDMFQKIEIRIDRTNILKISVLSFAFFAVIHWNACLYYAVSSWLSNLTGLYEPDHWFYHHQQLKFDLLRKYADCAMWSTIVLTNIGETDRAELSIEMIFMIIDFLAALVIFATIVDDVGALLYDSNSTLISFQIQFDMIRSFLARKSISESLKKRIVTWLKHTTGHNSDDVQRFLPSKIQDRLASNAYLKTLQSVQLFAQSSDPGFLREVAKKLKLLSFGPNEIICRKGDIGRQMFIVKEGKLIVDRGHANSKSNFLSAGTVLGEISLLNTVTRFGNTLVGRRTATVISVGFSRLLALSSKDLNDVLEVYPDMRVSLIQNGKALLRRDENLLKELNKNSALHENASKTGDDRSKASLERLKCLLEDIRETEMKLARAVAQATSAIGIIRLRVNNIEEL
ncbi:hypothetical protein ACOME3_008478 [Neoechinorhynchus agilis]